MKQIITLDDLIERLVETKQTIGDGELPISFVLDTGEGYYSGLEIEEIRVRTTDYSSIILVDLRT